MIFEKYETESGEEREAFFACEHCHAPIKRVGEDGIDFCSEGCGCIEGCANTYVDCDTDEVVSRELI